MNAVKVGLGIIALLITVVSLWVSRELIKDLEHEERTRMEVWAEAMRAMGRADESTDLTLVLKVLEENGSIPVIVLDAEGNVLEKRNLDDENINAEELEGEIENMKQAGRSIRILLTDEAESIAVKKKDYITICYGESLMLKRLASYPYVQLGVVALFALIGIYALLSSKRAEQNKVWVGLSRETAHQLGTPISSLTAWTEVLRETYPDDPMLSEMDKDVSRLRLIAERFSKIGSAPELREENLCDVVARVAEYISHRASDQVKMNVSIPADEVRVCMNAPLFEWVIENLCKNAIDAMQGRGNLDLYIYRAENNVVIEVTDTGKGISSGNFKNVFRPGYTTKKRGWGLGLSLAKRIVEEYHHGKIYVKRSQVGVGTTFAVELRLR
jgi:nitrogen-specific signal transduction histidine kinase